LPDKRERTRVLLVDDDASIRETMQLLLELEGFKTATASNGKEALEKLKAEQPSVILLDLMMPVMNGWELLEIIRGTEEYSPLPVIVISAFADSRVSSQATAIIRKPVDPDQLVRAVRKFGRVA
jgi:CheY-like chemotaxis protein